MTNQEIADYLTECKRCKEKGKVVRYIGESARTCYERGLEHQRDAVAEKENSHIHNHRVEHHPENDTGEKLFGMKVIQCHRSALTRQIQEAVLIANSQEELLNSKLEYNRCIIPRLAVMVGTKRYRPGEVARRRRTRRYGGEHQEQKKG